MLALANTANKINWRVIVQICLNVEILWRPEHTYPSAATLWLKNNIRRKDVNINWSDAPLFCLVFSGRSCRCLRASDERSSALWPFTWRLWCVSSGHSTFWLTARLKRSDKARTMVDTVTPSTYTIESEWVLLPCMFTHNYEEFVLVTELFYTHIKLSNS